MQLTSMALMSRSNPQQTTGDTIATVAAPGNHSDTNTDYSSLQQAIGDTMFSQLASKLNCDVTNNGH